MAQFVLDEKKDLLPTLLQGIVFESDLLKKLNAVDTIISALDDKMAENSGAITFKNWLHSKYLDNTLFMRQLKLHTAIIENVETKIEYYSQDYLTHQEYIFDADFEQVIITINKTINHFVGRLLRELGKGEELPF